MKLLVISPIFIYTFYFKESESRILQMREAVSNLCLRLYTNRVKFFW
jgi:hypothetical protein